MANKDDKNDVGYGKPPSFTQFVKGQSGNPRGRPKGSQNLSTILNKVGKEKVKITENGRTRLATKTEAVVLQLWNKAVSGDLNAARVLQSWLTSFAKLEENIAPSDLSDERDKSVMENILERIRQSENVSTESDADPPPSDPCGKKD